MANSRTAKQARTTPATDPDRTLQAPAGLVGSFGHWPAEVRRLIMELGESLNSADEIDRALVSYLRSGVHSLSPAATGDAQAIDLASLMAKFEYRDDVVSRLLNALASAPAPAPDTPVADAPSDSARSGGAPETGELPADKDAEIQRLAGRIAELEAELRTASAAPPVPAASDATRAGADAPRPLGWFAVALMEGLQLEFPVYGPELSIGRAGLNDLRLRNSAVSRQHVRIVAGEDGLRIIDCDSKNGMLVNSNRRKEAELDAGDTLVIGPATLIFLGNDGDLKPAD